MGKRCGYHSLPLSFRFRDRFQIVFFGDRDHRREETPPNACSLTLPLPSPGTSPSEKAAVRVDYRYEEDDLEYRAGRRMACSVGVPGECPVRSLRPGRFARARL